LKIAIRIPKMYLLKSKTAELLLWDTTSTAAMKRAARESNMYTIAVEIDTARAAEAASRLSG
jgi:hypothetical protein